MITRTPSTFLCTRCRPKLCEDCRDIADEYAELLQNHKVSLSNADHTLDELRRKLDAAQQSAKMWEDLAKLGMPKTIRQWMDSIPYIRALEAVADAARADTDPTSKVRAALAQLDAIKALPEALCTNE